MSQEKSEQPRAVCGVRRGARELVDGTIRVQIDIDPANRKAFFDLFAEIDMAVALAPLDLSAVRPPSRTEQDKPAHERSLAQRLHLDGYFRSRALWRALHEKRIYTLSEHKAWVEQQPCLRKGTTPCQGDIVLHHTPSSAIQAAGSALQPQNPNKPPHWYGVPLCHEHHRNWAHGSATREDKEALVVAAIALMADQAKRAMKVYIGLESLSGLTQEMLEEFESEIGLR